MLRRPSLACSIAASLCLWAAFPALASGPEPRQLLADAYGELSKNGILAFYGLLPPAKAPSASDLPTINGQGVRTWHTFQGSRGIISMEVQAATPNSVWIGVPHPTANASLWF